MTTQPAPVPEGYLSPDLLSPPEKAYAERLSRALRCGVLGCSCANPDRFHCPSHNNAAIPTLTVSYDPDHSFSFRCTTCSLDKVLDALAKRGLMPESHLYTTIGAAEAGLAPIEFLIQQPPDWLWPNRIPLGKLTLIAGYPSSGKTSVALDIAARVSRGAAAPDQPDIAFPCAPVVLALLDGNPKADVLPTLRLFGADLGRIYVADLLSPKHPIDSYPDEPPNDDGPDYEEDDDDLDDEEFILDAKGNLRRKPVGRRIPTLRQPKPKSNAAADTTAPWPSLNHAMKRLANYIEAGSAVLLIVDQVEDLASMHRAHVTTILGMLKALAARSGAAVIAVGHNPAPEFPRAVTAMQRRLAQASVVFTTALVGPGERRFLLPLRPAMSEDGPAIPFVLPPPPSSFLRRQEPRPFASVRGEPRPFASVRGEPRPLAPAHGEPRPLAPAHGEPVEPPPPTVIPAEAGIQNPPPNAYTVSWRKPVFPAHINALAHPNRDYGARIRAAQTFIVHALADGPRPAAAIEREAAMQGISRRTLFRARAACNIRSMRIGASRGPGAGVWHWSLPQRNTLQQDATPR